MTYNDYYLKFDTEAEQKTSYDPEENINLFPELSWDVIGVMHSKTGTMLTDSEGNQYPETTPIAGWHVNIRTKTALPVELVLYQIDTPTTPSRVFL